MKCHLFSFMPVFPMGFDRLHHPHLKSGFIYFYCTPIGLYIPRPGSQASLPSWKARLHQGQAGLPLAGLGLFPLRKTKCRKIFIPVLCVKVKKCEKATYMPNEKGMLSSNEDSGELLGE